MNRASMAKQITEVPMAGCKKTGMKKGGMVKMAKGGMVKGSKSTKSCKSCKTY